MAKKRALKSRNNRPTIAKLAEYTGYSEGAVSRAFNGQDGISSTTREKILKAAREIGYHPNPSARNFKRGYTKRVGIILPNLANPNYSELYENMDSVTSKAGYSSILALTQDSAEREYELIMQMSAGEADALVINPISNADNHDLYQRLKAWNYPMLFIYRYAGKDFDYLGVDYMQSLRKALEYLRDVGHESVAYVGPVPKKYGPVGKHAMLIDCLRDLNMAYDEELSVHEASPDNAGEICFSHWRHYGKYPSAVVAYNDQTAITIQTEARCLGVRIPEDFSLLGSDDIHAAKAVELSTVRVDRALMAASIFEMLENRLNHFDSPTRHKLLRSEFILRNTLGRAPQVNTIR